MTQSGTTSTQSTSDVTSANTRTTRIGAALGVVSIVLVATGFAIAMPTEATITSSPDEVAAFYEQAGLARTLAGGMIEVLGLVLFVPFAVMLSGRVGGPGVAGDVLAPTARTAAGIYVAVCLAPGMSAGATALWLAHHGARDAAVLTALNDLRSLSYFIALVPFAVFLVAIGSAARMTRSLPRWASTGAIVIGAALAVSVPFAGYGITDLLGLIGLVWVLAISVALLRRPLALPLARERDTHGRPS
jgi:hypothetical protein